MEPVYVLAARTAAISGFAVLLASVWSVPAAVAIVERRALLARRLCEALSGMPTVLVGLLLYLLLCGRCPLGWTGLLFTPLAVSIGEAILVTPVYIAFLANSLTAAYLPLYELGLSLGAEPMRARVFALRASAAGLVSGALAAFSRAAGELGVALLVGGNIEGYTRTLATSIALMVERGDYTAAALRGLMLASILASAGLAAWAAGRRLARG